MRKSRFILAIDQGTTSTKAIVLSDEGQIVGVSKAFGVDPIYPRPGWVEYDPQQILKSVCDAAASAVNEAGVTFHDIGAIGLDNQGETVIAFDGRDGRPVMNAISWQDRRTEQIIQRWRSHGLSDLVQQRSGLRLDPYFSAGKLKWILEHDAHAKELLEVGHLRLGTSDAWLIWMLTGGQRFVTDAATASRTMVLDLTTVGWSHELSNACGLPVEAMPSIVRCDEPVGETAKRVFGTSVPITGLCVDQHAAVFGHGCFKPGQAKATYGTGCFLLANAGGAAGIRARGLLTVLAWQLANDTAYAMEGGVYSAGSVIEWLVILGLLDEPAQLDEVAAAVQDTGGVCLIPAFSGLAAPHWQSRARACWTGMTHGTDRRHLVRAAVEAIAFRVREIFDAMLEADVRVDRLRVDGGLTRSRVLMQLQADTLNAQLEISENPQVTAIGVGLMAGLGAGLWKWPDRLPEASRVGFRYEPTTEGVKRCASQYERWRHVCLEVAGWGGTIETS